MSTTAPAPEAIATPHAVEVPAAPAPVAPAPPAPADPAIRTFRGRSLEELLPQIRQQLGPDAIVLRQRDGLMGGIGGFFQQRFVEVDARAGAPRIDTYDEEPEAPTAPTEPDAFAALLAEAADRGPRIHPPDRWADPRSSDDPVAEPSLDAQLATPAPTLTHELTAAGMSQSFAERLIAEAEAHELPFTNGDLREATRRALARRLPTSLPHRAGGLAVAFAGPGSTACADALATAYKRAGRDARAVASLDKARALLERDNPDAIVALDLPPIATDRAEVEALAERVATLALDETIVVLPAGLDLPTARQLLDRLQPLSPTALALSLDDQDAGIAAAIELACTTRLPIAYIHDARTGIAPADPTRLTERLLR
jgi:hypothetical protein